VEQCGRFTHAKGYSIWKKNTKAGMLARGKAVASQLHHERGQDETIGLRLREEPGNRIGGMHNIGIGEQQVIRLLRRGHGLVDALLDRPNLPGPARRQ